jgi:hypothetical protein
MTIGVDHTKEEEIRRKNILMMVNSKEQIGGLLHLVKILKIIRI